MEEVIVKKDGQLIVKGQGSQVQEEKMVYL